LREGDVIDGRFETRALARRGGMGEVWRAHDRLTGHAIALKVIASESDHQLERFAREARVLAEMQHPAIVRYVAHGHTASGEPYLAMEWLEGEDLRSRLARRALTAAESVALVRRVAEAVGAAHARGIVHRDLKPSNLFFVGDDPAAIKVVDFGVARMAGTAMTASGMMVGTPGYMAPEQVRGSKDVDARADVFSLGCVLFQCLTGRPPFAGEDLVSVLAKVLFEDAPALTSELLDPRLRYFVGRMLAKDKSKRPANGAEVAAELASLDALDDEERPPVSTAAPELTAGEQQLVCVLMARYAEPAGASAPLDSLTLVDARGEPKGLRSAIERFGGRLEVLASDTAIARLGGQGAAVDQAVQAARCALAVRELFPDVPLALGIGRGDLSSYLPVGDVLDRVAKLLDAASARRTRAVRIDDVTAGLLDARFVLGGDTASLWLESERGPVDETRKLLGLETPFVGRARELGTLQALLDECRTEEVARLVVVTGPAGAGKSRLRFELLRRARDVEVFVGRGDPMRAGSPFGLLGEALRRASGVTGGEAEAAQRAKLKARIARHVAPADHARVAEFLGEMAGVPFPDESSVQLRAARRDAMLMGDQIRRAWETFAVAETAAGPLVLVLEDLQWGDFPTVRLVDAALRALAERPFFVFALARPEVYDVFPRLWQERNAQEMRLGELTKKASERLVREVLGEKVAPDVVATLVDRAGGNAFYLEELIRATAEGKGDALPGTVLAMVQARLGDLEVASRRVLRAASIFGQHFWRRGVETLLGGEVKAQNVGAILDDLVAREIVNRRATSSFADEEELAFRHATLREAAYAMLTARDLRIGHKLAGDWLAAAGERDALLLAEHFERGGDPARAAAWYLRAAEQALEGNDLRGVLARAERGLACGATGEAAAALRIVSAEAHRWLGALAEAEAAALAAANDAPRASATWFRAIGELLTASGRLGHLERAIAWVDALLAAWFPATATETQIIATCRAAIVVLLAGRYELGERLLKIAESAPSRWNDDPVVLGHVERAWSLWELLYTGDLGEYRARNASAAAWFERAGDLRTACLQRANVGFSCLLLGAFEEAEGVLRALLGEADRMGAQLVSAVAAHNLGLALARLGRLDEAREVEERAAQAFALAGDLRLIGNSRAYLSQILLLAGDFAAAEKAAGEAIDALEAFPPTRALALAALADARLHQGRTTEALAAARDAMSLLDALGKLDEGEAQVRLVYAEALAATGDAASARSALQEARRRLVERAAKIKDEGLRASFLENVPENARTLSFAKQWFG
jgi:tetratricopeptide (TPR) repeat protein